MWTDSVFAKLITYHNDILAVSITNIFRDFSYIRFRESETALKTNGESKPSQNLLIV